MLAAPSHNSKLYSLTSRSIRRDSSLAQSPTLSKIRQNFSAIAEHRRINRSPSTSIAEQLSGASSASVDGSQSGEEGLKRALEAALGSLAALSTMYDQREARWREEMRRLGEDRERAELLLRQVLGPALLPGEKQHEEQQLLG